MTDTVLLLCWAVMVLSVVLALSLACVPLLLWQCLRQAHRLAQVELDLKGQEARLVQARVDIEKLDAVLDGILSGGRAE